MQFYTKTDPVVCARETKYTLRCSQQFANSSYVSQTTRRSNSDNIELREFSLLLFTVVCLIFKQQLNESAFTTSTTAANFKKINTHTFYRRFNQL